MKDLDDRDCGSGYPHLTKATPPEREPRLPNDTSYLEISPDLLPKLTEDDFLGNPVQKRIPVMPEPSRTYLHNADFTLKAAVVTVAATAAGAGLILAAHHLYTCLIR